MKRLWGLLVGVLAIVPVTLQGQELDVFYSSMAHNSHKVALVKTQEQQYAWVATSHISRGEAIIGIPLELCITSFDTFPLSEYLTDFQPDTILALRLLYEKFVNERGGFINSYVHSLPVNLTQTSLWSEEQQETLKHEINYGVQVKYASDLTNTYYLVKRKLKHVVPDEMLEWDAWVWAMTLSQAKGYSLDRYTWLTSIGYPAEARDRTTYGGAFYPLIDLVPHYPLPMKYRGEQHRAVVMQSGKKPGPILIADRDFKPKQVIVCHNRNMTNYEMLFLHGYFMDRNLDETFDVSVGEDPTCPGIVRKGECFFTLNVTSINFKLLNWLRILNSVTVIKATPRNIDKIYMSPGANETQTHFTTALVMYRDLLTARMKQTYAESLRKQRRSLQLVNETYYHTSVRLGVSQKVAMHAHLAKVERLTLRLVLAALSL